MNEALAPAIPGVGRIALPDERGPGLIARLFSARRDSAETTGNTLEKLIERLQSGDDSALEAFIEATQDMAYRLAFSILNDRERCRDVLQETYLTVYLKIGQLREPRALRGWFSQILVNRCRQELRDRKLSNFEELLEEPGVDGMSERVDLQVDVQQAMRTLPSADQAVLTMREVCQLSYQEIAESLEVPVGTVRSRLFNARARLLAALSPKKRSKS